MLLKTEYYFPYDYNYVFNYKIRNKEVIIKVADYVSYVKMRHGLAAEGASGRHDDVFLKRQKSCL